MLAYPSYSNFFETYTILSGPCTPSGSSGLTAGMDPDASQFFRRMTEDVCALAAAAGRPLYARAAAQRLRMALIDSTAERTASWRRVYILVACLLIRCSTEVSARTLHDGRIDAFKRLAQFLDENADLVVAPVSL